jgi:hypothetical protein
VGADWLRSTPAVLHPNTRRHGFSTTMKSGQGK